MYFFRFCKFGYQRWYNGLLRSSCTCLQKGLLYVERCTTVSHTYLFTAGDCYRHQRDILTSSWLTRHCQCWTALLSTSTRERVKQSVRLSNTNYVTPTMIRSRVFLLSLSSSYWASIISQTAYSMWNCWCWVKDNTRNWLGLVICTQYWLSWKWLLIKAFVFIVVSMFRLFWIHVTYYLSVSMILLSSSSQSALALHSWISSVRYSRTTYIHSICFARWPSG